MTGTKPFQLQTAWEPCDQSVFAAAWSAEAGEAANTVDTEIIRIATGLLLPIWSAPPSDHLAVNRIEIAEAPANQLA